LIDYKKDGLVGVAVSNSPAIGAAGLVFALDALQKKECPHLIQIVSAMWDNTTDAGVEALKAMYDPNIALQIRSTVQSRNVGISLRNRKNPARDRKSSLASVGEPPVARPCASCKASPFL
jgi:hypothetical protein